MKVKSQAKAHQRWTADELEYLKNNHENKSCKEMASDLGVTLYAVQKQMSRLGLPGSRKRETRVWTDEETEYIQNNYLQYSDKEMAQSLNRPVYLITETRRKLGLSRRKRNKVGEKEEKYIIDHYKNQAAAEIAQYLDLPAATVIKTANKLGVYKILIRAEWTAETDEWLKENYKIKTSREIADDLNTTPAAVRNRIAVLGIKKEDVKERDLERVIRLPNSLANQIQNISSKTEKSFAETVIKILESAVAENTAER